jgi:hypothetical protein
MSLTQESCQETPGSALVSFNIRLSLLPDMVILNPASAWDGARQMI